MDEAQRRIEAVFRIEWARLVAGLARLVRGDLGAAEELAQDALVAALESWRQDGIPQEPGAWLMQVAKNRALKRLDRRRRWERTESELAQAMEGRQNRAASAIEEAADDDVGDDLLRLVFASCHPSLSADSRVALTLRVVLGLTTQEIACAFVIPETTAAQRIVRAKKTLASAGAAFQLSPRASGTRRLPFTARPLPRSTRRARARRLAHEERSRTRPASRARRSDAELSAGASGRRFVQSAGSDRGPLDSAVVA